LTVDVISIAANSPWASLVIGATLAMRMSERGSPLAPIRYVPWRLTRCVHEETSRQRGAVLLHLDFSLTAVQIPQTRLGATSNESPGLVNDEIARVQFANLDIR
jgi:hypothetical protein